MRLAQPSAGTVLFLPPYCCHDTTPAPAAPRSCSYPNTPEQTIPNNLAALYNWLCMILAAIVIELLLLRKQHSLTVGITGICSTHKCMCPHTHACSRTQQSVPECACARVC
jgi:hypothetical protein